MINIPTDNPEKVKKRLENLENIYNDGNLMALYETISICNSQNIIGQKKTLEACENMVLIPEWALSGLISIFGDYLNEAKTGKKGKDSKYLTRYLQDKIDFCRYEKIRDLLEHPEKPVKWDDVYEYASNYFEKLKILFSKESDPDPFLEKLCGSPDTMKATYRRVKNNLETNPNRYAQFKFVGV